MNVNHNSLSKTLSVNQAVKMILSLMKKVNNVQKLVKVLLYNIITIKVININAYQITKNKLIVFFQIVYIMISNQITNYVNHAKKDNNYSKKKTIFFVKQENNVIIIEAKQMEQKFASQLVALRNVCIYKAINV